MGAFECKFDGTSARVAVDRDALVVGGRSIAYVDIDDVSLTRPRVGIDVVGGARHEISFLGKAHDEFVDNFLSARRRSRRAALLQWTGDKPIDEYESRAGDEPLTVVLFPDGVIVESLNAPPVMAPLSLVNGIDRDGYRITLQLRALPSVEISALGKRTDEFLLDLDGARKALATRTAEAYAGLADSLRGFAAPDGWAVGRGEAGSWWGALRAGVAAEERSEEVAVLESLAGDRLRAGIKSQPQGEALPFVLAWANGKVAVEGTGDVEGRATFVFRTDDVDQLNVALLLTSFRREAISLPVDQLGRWALAVRTLDIVRWAREALVARVIHDDTWADKVRAALS